jgi:hypothetical protein
MKKLFNYGYPKFYDRFKTIESVWRFTLIMISITIIIAGNLID